MASQREVETSEGVAVITSSARPTGEVPDDSRRIPASLDATGTGHAATTANLGDLKRRQEAGYMPQLDALRAFAVAGVLWIHFYQTQPYSGLPWGFLGVRLFFVLSGFLITGVLLHCRTLMERGGQTLGFTLRRFYLRRALRIFPVYYVTVIIVAIIGIYEMRRALPWDLAYLSNFYYAWLGGWRNPGFHFWSLAVEEQFYLVWPLVVLAAPRKWLVGISIAAICSAPIYRLIAFLLGGNDITITMLPFGCIDTLCAGALLAMLRNDQSLSRTWLPRLVPTALFAGLPMLVLLMTLRYSGKHYHGLITAFEDIPLAIVFVALMHRAADGFVGPTRYVLEFPPLRWIGRVSYGIYVFHLFLIYPFLRYQHKTGFKLPESGLTRVLILSAGTIAVATVSWFVMERPINELKKHFPYGKPAAKAS